MRHDIGKKLVVRSEPLRGSGSQNDGPNVPHLDCSARDLHDLGENRDGNFSWPFCADRQSNRGVDTREHRIAEARGTKPFQALGVCFLRAQGADIQAVRAQSSA